MLDIKFNRRNFLFLATGLASGYFLAQGVNKINVPRSKVALVKVPKYSLDVKSLLKPYFNQFNLSLKGKQVLLKPNLVDFHGEDHYINTHPTIMAAAIELFGDLGAKVVVAEASGLRRDINTILHYAHYKKILDRYGVAFVDLNIDTVDRVRIPSNLTGLEHFYIPKTVLDSDFVVSMPKLKTHHWMGVTLSLKNMFGIMPGLKYGWPKNKLHYVGVERSIIDINHTVKPDFTIIDGVYGLEGNGPLFGDNKYVGVVAMSDDPLAADYVCARVMGVDPDKVKYLKLASMPLKYDLSPLGNVKNIEIIGETVNQVRQNFKLLDEFSSIRL